MKKQYLIGLLGVAAISVPMGSSLLSANSSSIAPAAGPTIVESGVSVSGKNSSISFYDMDGNEEISAGDEISAVDISGSFIKPTGDYKIDSKGDLVIWNISENESPVDGVAQHITIGTVSSAIEWADVEGTGDFTYAKTADDFDKKGSLIAGTNLKDGSKLAFQIDMKSKQTIPPINAEEEIVGSVKGNITLSNDDLTPPPDDGGSADSESMGGWAVFGIIVAVALGVGIIGYAGYYLYNKYAAKKA